MAWQVIMLIDNAAVHTGFEVKEKEGFDGISFSYMLVVFLPTTTTCHVQPLDQGITNSWKFKYRAELVSWLVRMYDSLPAEQDVSKVAPYVVLVLQWVCSAWKEVTAECVQNCWWHSSIMEAPELAPMQRRQTKAAKRWQRLADFAAKCFAPAEIEAVEQLSDSEQAAVCSSSDSDARGC
jgi:hypothetical protein